MAICAHYVDFLVRPQRAAIICQNAYDLSRQIYL